MSNPDEVPGVDLTDGEKRGLIGYLKSFMTEETSLIIEVKTEKNRIIKLLLSLVGSACPIELSYTASIRGDTALEMKMTIEEVTPGGDIEIRTSSYRSL